MIILVNGHEHECPEGSTVAALLAAMTIPPTGTAVARNGVLVRKAQHADTLLLPGDRIEIIHAVAGG